jgi:hypothetical protein
MNRRAVLSKNGQVFSYRLHNFNSIFTAELYAIYRALLFIRRQLQQCHLICTDSLSALQGLNCYSPGHPIVIEILIQLSHLHQSATSIVLGGFLATLACPATKLPMQQLKRQLYTERLFLIELSVVTFAPSFIALFYPRGKTNGKMLRETSCLW